MSVSTCFTIKKRNRGFNPQVVVDVGANKGMWTKRILELFPTAKVLMIEASTQHRKDLERVTGSEEDNVEFLFEVLSSQSGQVVDFYETGDTGNSMFKENTIHYQDSVPTKKTTKTLDEVVGNSALVNQQAVDLLKLDVQGAELSVLQGATRVLSEASFVQLETSVVEFNVGGACPWEIDDYLRGKGYRILDIWDLKSNPKLFQTTGLGQYDVLYLNTNRRPDGLKDIQFCKGSSTTTTKPATLQQQSLFLNEAAAAPQEVVSTLNSAMGYFACLVLGYLICYVQGRLSFRTTIARRRTRAAV